MRYFDKKNYFVQNKMFELALSKIHHTNNVMSFKSLKYDYNHKHDDKYIDKDMPNAYIVEIVKIYPSLI